MLEITRKIKIYKFKELKENVQEKIINDFITMIAQETNFEELNKNTNLYKAYLECERMQTPWFLGQYIWEYDKNHILKMCNSYNYTSNGEIYYEEEK